MDYPALIPLLDNQTNPHLLVVGGRAQATRVLVSRFAAAAAVVYLTAVDEIGPKSRSAVTGSMVNLIDAMTGTQEGASRLRTILLQEAAALEATQEHPDLIQAATQVLITLAAKADATMAPEEANSGIRYLPMRFGPEFTRETAAALIADVVSNASDRALPHPLVMVRPNSPAIDARESKYDLQRGDLDVGSLTLLVPVSEECDWRPYANQEMTSTLTRAEIDQVRQLGRIELKALYPHIEESGINEMVDSTLDDRIWAWALEHAMPASKRAGVVSSRDILNAFANQRDPKSGLAILGNQVNDLLSGPDRMPDWWGKPGLITVSTRHCSDLRRSLLIDALMDAAAAPAHATQPKAIIIDDDAFMDGEALVRLSHLLRQARKLHIYTIVVTDSQEPNEMVVALAGTAVAAHSHRAVIGKAPELDPAPFAWLKSARSLNPEPLAQWYESAEVVRGERLITGIITEDEEVAHEA